MPELKFKKPKPEEEPAVKAPRYKRLLPFIPLPFVLALIILLVISRLPKAADKVPWTPLPLPDLRDDAFIKAGGESSFYKQFLNGFLHEKEVGAAKIRQKWAVKTLKLEHEKPDDVSTPQVLREVDGGVFTAEDQLLLGTLLTARRDHRGFKEWQDHFLAAFPEADPTQQISGRGWQLSLRYIRVLLQAGQVWAEQGLIDEALRTADLLLPLFQEAPPAVKSSDFNEIYYPEPDAAEARKSFDEEIEVSYIPLQFIDLWTLKSLSALDEQWLPVYQKWLDIVKHAGLDSGFYAFAVSSDLSHYIPSAGKTFKTDTLSTVMQLQSLSECGEPDVNGMAFLMHLIYRDGYLCSSYNLGSLAVMDKTAAREAELRLLELAAADTTDVNRQGIREALKQSVAGPDMAPATKFIYYKDEDQIYFSFRENALALLCGLDRQKP